MEKNVDGVLRNIDILPWVAEDREWYGDRDVEDVLFLSQQAQAQAQAITHDKMENQGETYT